MSKRIYKFGILLATTFLLSSFCLADTAAKTDSQATPTPTPDKTINLKSSPTHLSKILVPAPPTLDAGAFVLEDFRTGRVIASKNPNQRMSPASLTKLMTLYVVASAIKAGQIGLDDQVRISKKAWQIGGSKMFVKIGTKVPLRDLMEGVIVASGNDASTALAEYVAGSEGSFVSLMNQTAQRLGMTGTHFTDATGMPHPDHYTTAANMATLTRALITNFPDIYPMFKQKWITYNGIRQPNRNRLLWRDPSVDGLKTGHTSAAGYCLIASAQRNDMRLIAVVMHADSDSNRNGDAEKLLTYGFRFYHTEQLMTGGKSLVQHRVWGGKEKEIDFGVKKDLYATIPVGVEKDSLKTTITMDNIIHAPLALNQAVGTVTVTNTDGDVIASEPLVALQADAKGSMVRRATDSVKLFFHKMFSSKKKEITV